ncbi:MAG: FRG domain-containing protein, partial [Bacillota bacterium]
MNSSNVISQDELEKLILKRDKAIESNNRFTNNVKKPEFRKKTFQNVPARYELYSTMINNGTTFMDDGRMISRYGSIGDFGKYYRGEHKKFPNTKSKLARELNKNASETDKLSKIVIQYFRIFFMHDYIKKIRNIDKWDIGCISTDLIAQHYGLSTMFIDLTDDIRVALFFACTKTNDNGSFQYLTEYDLDNEYGRDGYIHIINKGPEFDIGIKPIGYQPFT